MAGVLRGAATMAARRCLYAPRVFRGPVFEVAGRLSSHEYQVSSIISPAGVTTASFSSRTAKKGRDRRMRGGGKKQEAEALPTLQVILRKFYLKVHPDLFTHYPEQKNINQESFSRFQAFLDEVRDKNTVPPRAGLHSYRFFLKTQEEGKFKEVSMELRTTGGDCRNVVQRALTTFFKDCGLPEHFQWAEGDWAYTMEELTAAEEEEQQQKQ